MIVSPLIASRLAFWRALLSVNSRFLYDRGETESIPSGLKPWDFAWRLAAREPEGTPPCTFKSLYANTRAALKQLEPDHEVLLGVVAHSFYEELRLVERLVSVIVESTVLRQLP